MKRLSLNLSVVLATLLVAGLTPLQAVHAQTMPMQPQSTTTTGCAGPCTTTSPIAVIESDQSEHHQQADRAQPTQSVPYYLRFTQPLRVTESAGELRSPDHLPAPPDLVIRYANLRC